MWPFLRTNNPLGVILFVSVSTLPSCTTHTFIRDGYGSPKRLSDIHEVLSVVQGMTSKPQIKRIGPRKTSAQ